MINSGRSIKKIVIALILLIIVPAVLTGSIFKISKNKPKEYRNAENQIVVIFHNEINDDNLAALTDSLPAPVKIVRHIGDYALLSVGNRSQYSRVIKSLKSNDKVQVAQKNYSVNSLGFSNDTYARTQWALDNPRHSVTVSGKTTDVDMDVPEAWEQYRKDAPVHREVVVAVIDTGVDYNHPELSGHMWKNSREIPDDGIDNDNNGYIDDVYGWDFYNNDSSTCHYKFSKEYNKNLADPGDDDDHGTHVAGIIAAEANNNMGIAGVASNIDVKIMTLKINGGSSSTGSISNAIEAIKYATMMGADICNMSWGSSQSSPVLKEVMKESDMLFVAAAGNSGANNDINAIYPADFKLDNLISVAFINSSGELNNQSNYGPDCVDLAAPGDNIFSTIVGSYAIMSGSSMAAPHVSGVAAMLYAYRDKLYPANIKKIIIDNMKPLNSLKGYVKNPGIPSALRAINASDRLENDTQPPVISLKTVYNKDKLLIPVSAEDRGGSGIRTMKWDYGSQTLDRFHHGASGISVENNELSVSKVGTYTFYAADYAGNEIIKTYTIKDDITAPKITASYSVAKDYKSRNVTVKISDSQSGIRRAMYMPGIKNASDFLPDGTGTGIKLKDGKGSFNVKKDGTYTIFASDYRGNLIVKNIIIKTIKADKISLSQKSKTMYTGSLYTLKTAVLPANTTDHITYTSSNTAIATVTYDGKVKAVSKGRVYITARTSSGAEAVCKITVKWRK